jgi:hypothetical protein
MVLAGDTTLAQAAGDTGRDQNRVARLQVFGRHTQPGDVPGDLAAGNQRERKLVALDTFPQPEVEPVERTSSHLDQHFVRSRLGFG